MRKDIRYCQICHHRMHTKMEGITCKRGMVEFNGRCERFLEDEVARELLMEKMAEERDSPKNVMFTIYCVEFIVILAMMCGAYFGNYKIGHFSIYLVSVVLLGFSGAACAWGIDRLFQLHDSRRHEGPLTMDAVAECIHGKGVIQFVSENEVRFRIQGREYLIMEDVQERMMLRTDFYQIPHELTAKAQCAAYETSFESHMIKVVVFRHNTSMLKHAEISVQFMKPSEKEFRKNFDKYLGDIDAACELFRHKLYDS